MSCERCGQEAPRGILYRPWRGHWCQWDGDICIACVLTLEALADARRVPSQGARFGGNKPVPERSVPPGGRSEGSGW